MTPRDVLGRALDLAQIVLGAGVMRPLFSQLRARRSEALHRTRHEPFAALGESFVRSVGVLEKAAFLAKMLGTDGGWAERTEVSSHAPSEDALGARFAADHTSEVLFAGDILFPGVLDEETLSPALRRRIEAATCFVANLEATVGDRPHELAPLLTARGIAQLRAYAKDPTNLDWVSRLDVAGLRAIVGGASRAVVSVANNHTLDDGVAGFDETVRRVREAGVGVVGDARDEAVIVGVGAHRLGLFALTYGSNREVGAPRHGRFDGVPYRLQRARVAELVASLRMRGATHVVALLHWGYEHEHEPAPEQRAVVELLFEEGVAAVIGHHPHLAQRNEERGGRWVSYSLGDFVGGDRTIWSRFGWMVSLRLGSEGGVRGGVVPVVQTPYWRRQRTSLLDEAPALERAVFGRWFRSKLPAPFQGAAS